MHISHKAVVVRSIQTAYLRVETQRSTRQLGCAISRPFIRLGNGFTVEIDLSSRGKALRRETVGKLTESTTISDVLS